MNRNITFDDLPAGAVFHTEDSRTSYTKRADGGAIVIGAEATQYQFTPEQARCFARTRIFPGPWLKEQPNRTLIKIAATNVVSGEALNVCVRELLGGYEVFIDGGLLADGEESTLVGDLRAAMQRATDEAVCHVFDQS